MKYMMLVCALFVGSSVQAQDSTYYADVAEMYFSATSYDTVAEVPTTPVPPVPTDWQQYQGLLVRLFSLRAQIETAKADLNLYAYLFSISPDHDEVRSRYYYYLFLVETLENEADEVRAIMLTLQP